MKLLSFSADYIQGGIDRHEAVQVAGCGGDIHRAARAVFSRLVAQGKAPQAIIHFPGEYTMRQLETLIDTPTRKLQCVPLYFMGKGMKGEIVNVDVSH